MLANNQKTSILIPSQLPAFIRDDPNYENFVLFLQAYYEWMEQSGNVTDVSKNILNYQDIDSTSGKFLDYFVNDFIPHFPEQSLISKEQAVKIAKQLYQNKGTPASYKFLFRTLYNSDFDSYNTDDFVLKPSSGNWYTTKSLMLSTTDINFLDIAGYRLLGSSSLSIATVENSAVSGNKIEVFISNIERLFESGETVTVVDNKNQPVLFDGEYLSATIVGQINQINIDPKNRGLLYQPGDPVSIYGGLNTINANPAGATAIIGTTTVGEIKRINVVNGGYGYTLGNTLINITDAVGAIATVGGVNVASTFAANVNLIPVNEIGLSAATKINNASYVFANGANANTKLINAFSFNSFSTYPLSAIIVQNGGSQITKIPTVTAVSATPTDVSGVYGNLDNLGILAPIQIANGGTGYRVGDKIIFTGGNGYGANAYVTAVGTSNTITAVAYTATGNNYSIGGMGYTSDYLPTLTVQSANNQASNASLYVPSVLGEGATFSVVVDRAGSVTTILIEDYGQDYVASPGISLKVQDIAVANVDITNIPKSLDIVFQGATLNTASYRANVDITTVLQPDLNSANTIYNLRLFDYSSTDGTGKPNPTLPLKVAGTKNTGTNMRMYNTALPQFGKEYFDGTTLYTRNYDDNGIITYGDGTAKASATFLNGLRVSQGQYLNDYGQPSSSSVIQNDVYNNYTYVITVQKEISKYRNVLLNLLHPSGMKLIGKYSIESNTSFDLHGFNAIFQGHTMAYYTGYNATQALITTDFVNKTNNIITFTNLAGTNIANVFVANSSIISIQPTTGPNVYSLVTSVNGAANSITVQSNTWLTFANVAYATANATTRKINIKLLTDSYSYFNNGDYSNPDYPLMDIVYAGDYVRFSNGIPLLVQSVDYINGILTIDPSTTVTTTANTLLSVKRTFLAGDSVGNYEQIRIYNSIGQVYVPELADTLGNSLITEAGQVIILG
ncbi:hypothetical protein UFOVP250_12 [uncultured Caudovirales phage]|uniref:Baseplate wedge subunit n=1 Tax=uncultured Caudovirales phage TaxID=2100421 RepID=A0A6J5LE45_9CAUD|nr:hypothetical protein UFOVP250_12 [uncultured Caudovirales phage]